MAAILSRGRWVKRKLSSVRVPLQLPPWAALVPPAAASYVMPAAKIDGYETQKTNINYWKLMQTATATASIRNIGQGYEINIQINKYLIHNIQNVWFFKQMWYLQSVSVQASFSDPGTLGDARQADGDISRPG